MRETVIPQRVPVPVNGEDAFSTDFIQAIIEVISSRAFNEEYGAQLSSVQHPEYVLQWKEQTINIA